MPWRMILDIVGFQLAWWASALGAAAGHWQPGVAVGAAVIAVQLAMSGARAPLIGTVAAAALIGIVAETAMVAGGLVTYAAVWPAAGMAPAWLVTLWMVFATCIDSTARMLGTNAMAKAIVLGAVVAPPTYWAGARFGALTLAEPSWPALAALAVAWMIAMPLMLAIHGRLSGR